MKEFGIICNNSKNFEDIQNELFRMGYYWLPFGSNEVMKWTFNEPILLICSELNDGEKYVGWNIIKNKHLWTLISCVEDNVFLRKRKIELIGHIT